MSTFICPLVKIPGHGKHKNADSLRITQIEGSVCIFKEGGFEKGDLAVFIPVDAVVPLYLPAFSWLKDKQRPNKTHHRVKALRLRGVFSDGFLVPLNEIPLFLHRDGDQAVLRQAPANDGGPTMDVLIYDRVKLGDDMSTRLGVVKFEEELPANMGGNAEKYGPDVPVYDIEPWKKFKGVFDDPTEQVVVTEKLHGTNSRFAFIDGRLWVGSRNRFLYQEERNLWWRIAAEHKLEEKLAQRPNLVLYGETFGDVQDLKYGHDKGVQAFRAFDIYDTASRKYLDYHAFVSVCDELGIPMVPVLYRGEIGDGFMVEHLTNPDEEDGKPYTSVLDGKTLREGVVVKPIVERWNHSTHRTILKHVSRGYLLRKGGTEAH